MPRRDVMLALLVAACCGVNFTAIHLSLVQFPPFFLAGVRFTLLAVPTLLLVPRPAVPWRWVLGYGLGFGVLQFAFLYTAMDLGMPTGLASLVLQSSAPFSVLLGAVWLHERLDARRLVALALAIVGLGGIAAHRAGLGGAVTLLPVLLTLCGGLGWAWGNLCSRQARTQSPLRLLLWMSVVPPIPLLALALPLDGLPAIRTSLTTLATPQGALALGGLAYTVVIATMLGTGIWTSLLSRHPASVVAPFSMLVPVVGITVSWVVLGEPTPGVELMLGGLVVGGVLLGGTQTRASRAPRQTPGSSRRPSPRPPSGMAPVASDTPGGGGGTLATASSDRNAAL